MENKYITRNEDGNYIYNRYEALVDVARETLGNYGMAEVDGKYGVGQYSIVQLPDELHILCCDTDLMSLIGDKAQYEEGNEVELISMYNSDVESIKGIITKTLCTNDNVSEERTNILIPVDDWGDYFSGDEDDSAEMLKSWGNGNGGLFFEDMEEFNQFWRRWGRYFVCDILNN